VGVHNWRQWRIAVVTLHGAQIVVLLALGIPQIVKVQDQLASDYVPEYYPLFVVFAFAPVLLALATFLALALWAVRLRTSALLFVDAFTVAATYSLLLLYLMATPPVVLLLLLLAPACLILMLLVATRQQSGRT
jgi:hypothetical protein